MIQSYVVTLAILVAGIVLLAFEHTNLGSAQEQMALLQLLLTCGWLQLRQ